jgi:hypothetical protein
MSNKTDAPKSDQLDTWLRELEVGRVLRIGSPQTELISGEIKLLGWRANYSTPIPLPHLAEFLKRTHDEFTDALPEGYERLKKLESSLQDRLLKLFDTVKEQESQIDELRATVYRFKKLADRFATLEEAEAEQGLPEGLRSLAPHNEELDEVPQDLPLYVTDSEAFGGTSEGTQICLLRTDSPLRVAAFARLVRLRLKEKYGRVYRVFAVGRIRYRILARVLAHFEITGIPPAELTSEEAQEEAEAMQDEGKRRGRPPAGDPAKRKEVVEELLSKPAFWHFSGRHKGKPNYKALFQHVSKHHPEAFNIGSSGIRKMTEKRNIDLDALREAVKAPPPDE